MLFRLPHVFSTLGIPLVLCSVSLPARAINVVVNQGTDYVVTPPEGAKLTLPGFGLVQFTGLPIGTPTVTPPSGGYGGSADTVVNRLDNIYDNQIVTGGNTALEIVGLSLVARNQYNINDHAYFDIYAGLQKYYTPIPSLSTGSMTIKDSGLLGGKLWSSTFTINGVAVVVPVNTDPIASGNDYVKRLIQGCPSASYTCHTFTKGPFAAYDEPWSATPLPGQFEGPNLVNPSLPQNFFLTSKVDHVAPDNGIHTIVPTPAPLSFLGAPAVMACLGRLKKASSQLKSLKSV